MSIQVSDTYTGKCNYFHMPPSGKKGYYEYLAKIISFTSPLLLKPMNLTFLCVLCVFYGPCEHLYFILRQPYTLFDK